MGRIKEALTSTGKALQKSFPVLLGVLILVSLAGIFLDKGAVSSLFSENILLDPFIGSILGSVLAGNPITSYVLGGELLDQGISLVAVIAFIVAWVTVGVIQLPAESVLLGKKFAVVRNITAFFMAIAVAIVTVLIMRLI